LRLGCQFYFVNFFFILLENLIWIRFEVVISESIIRFNNIVSSSWAIYFQHWFIQFPGPKISNEESTENFVQSLIVVLSDSYLIKPGQMLASLSMQDSSNLIYLIENCISILVSCYINFGWSVDEVQEKNF
jgi:hypothetical protein